MGYVPSSEALLRPCSGHCEPPWGPPLPALLDPPPSP